MTKLQSKLQELRELVEAKTVVCPRCRGLGALPEPSRDIQPSPCDDCDGTGRIPDPAYAPLLKVVRAPCEKFGRPHWHQEIYYRSKDNCHRYLTRSWDELPEGALAGALEVATKSLSLLFPYPWDLIYANGKEDATALEYTLYVLKEEAK